MLNQPVSITLKPFAGFILLLTFLSACSQWGKETPETYVMKYKDKYLTQEAFRAALPQSLTKKDSASYAQKLVEQWLENQIIIDKAVRELPSSKSNVKQEVEQYKADLLYYRYEDFYVKNKINTQVSLQELEEYYNNNKDRLISPSILVKAIYVEISKKQRDRYKAKSWLKSMTEKSLEKLKVYCFQKAKVFDDFEGEWIPFSKLEELTESKKLRYEGLSTKKVMTVIKEKTVVYIALTDIIREGQIMPLEYAKDKIVENIISDRKQKLKEALDVKIEQTVNDYLSK